MLLKAVMNGIKNDKCHMALKPTIVKPFSLSTSPSQSNRSYSNFHYQNIIAAIVGGFVTSQKKKINLVVRGNKSFQQTIGSKDAISPTLKDGILLYV